VLLVTLVAVVAALPFDADDFEKMFDDLMLGGEDDEPLADLDASSSSVTYKVVVLTSTRRYADSGDLISVQVGNTAGDLWTEPVAVGVFSKGESRTITFSSLNVGPVGKVRFHTTGTNGWLDDSTTVIKKNKKTLFKSDGTFLKCRSTGCTKELTASSGGDADCEVCVHTATDGDASRITSDWETKIEGKAQITKRQYRGFIDWIDCARKGPVRFDYVAKKDCGCLPRPSSFYIDPVVDRKCQPSSTSSYGPTHDRGHMVPANHFDFDAVAIKETNFITNILPQTYQLNRGAWLHSEEIIECLREVEPLHVIGGAVWRAEPTNEDKFLAESHGVPAVPVAFWKMVRAKTLYPKDNNLIAWWFPNDAFAERAALDKFIVSISQLEKLLSEEQTVSTDATNFAIIGEKFTGLSKSVRQHVPSRSWAIPRGCRKK